MSTGNIFKLNFYGPMHIWELPRRIGGTKVESIVQTHLDSYKSRYSSVQLEC